MNVNNVLKALVNEAIHGKTGTHEINGGANEWAAI